MIYSPTFDSTNPLTILRPHIACARASATVDPWEGLSFKRMWKHSGALRNAVMGIQGLRHISCSLLHGSHCCLGNRRQKTILRLQRAHNVGHSSTTCRLPHCGSLVPRSDNINGMPARAATQVIRRVEWGSVETEWVGRISTSKSYGRPKQGAWHGRWIGINLHSKTIE